MTEKSRIDKISDLLEKGAKCIALLVGAGLLLAALLMLEKVIFGLWVSSPELAVQEGIFVMLLLEMVYVVRSFIKYGSINVALVINVGMIAIVKELVFKIPELDLQIAISFSIVLFGLGVAYLMETILFRKKKSAQLGQ